jgi:hypothetical protein
VETLHPETTLAIGDRGTCQAKTADAIDAVRFGAFEFFVRAEPVDGDTQFTAPRPWVHLYAGRSKHAFFDCNPAYFEANFLFVKAAG